MLVDHNPLAARRTGEAVEETNAAYFGATPWAFSPQRVQSHQRSNQRCANAGKNHRNTKKDPKTRQTYHAAIDNQDRRREESQDQSAEPALYRRIFVVKVKLRGSSGFPRTYGSAMRAELPGRFETCRAF
jgi:hypothetical protein